MKKTIVKVVLALLMLAAYISTPSSAVADSVPLPMCWPNPCQPQ